MKSVAIVLLATLLPACFVIAILSGLSLYLFIKLRSLRTSTQKIQNVADQPEPVTQAIEDSQPLAEDYDPTKRVSALSDASNPDWGNDLKFLNFDASGANDFGVSGKLYRHPDDESWAREVLEDIKYKGGVPVPVILSFLRQKDLYDGMIDHIMNHVVLERLSLDGDPVDSLLPFKPDTHRFLRGMYKSLEGVKLSPEMAAYISKVPFLFADEYAREHASGREGIKCPLHLYNKEVHKRLSARFAELLGELVDPVYQWFAPDIRGDIRRVGAKDSLNYTGLDEAVELHLRMMASRRQLRYKWPQETTANGSRVDDTPAIYAFADEDGMPLQEPLLVSEPYVFKIENSLGGKLDIENKAYDSDDFKPFPMPQR